MPSRSGTSTSSLRREEVDKLYMGYRYGSRGYYEPWASRDDTWLLTNGLYINVVLWEYLGSIGALDLLYLAAGGGRT